SARFGGAREPPARAPLLPVLRGVQPGRRPGDVRRAGRCQVPDHGSDTKLMSGGFVVMVLALAERAGVAVDWPVEEQQWPREQLAELRERGHAHASSLPSV